MFTDLIKLWEAGGPELVLLATLIWVLWYVLTKLSPILSNILGVMTEIKIWMENFNGDKKK